MFLILVNLTSGSQKNQQKVDIIQELMKQKGKDTAVEIIHKGNTDKDRICSMVKDCHEVECVIIAGGDGTVAKIINWFYQENIDVPIGLIPSGTCNDFGESLQLGITVEEQVNTILNGHTVMVDLGESCHKNQKRMFICCYEIGDCSYVSYGAPKVLKKYLKHIAYYGLLLRVLFRIKPFHVHMDIDGTIVDQKILGALVLNGSRFGKIPDVIPEAKPTDGKMDIVVMTGTKREAVSILLKMFTGKSAGDPHFQHFQFTHLQITATSDIDAMIDGEKADGLPVVIDVHPKAARIFATESIPI